jgi:lipopolysaccharide transport system ATP-binding protein
MARPVIEAVNVSKRFTIGARAAYGSLREEITQAVLGPFKRLTTRPAGPGPDAATPSVWALKDVSFEVDEGAVVGIIGRNGAGKSTLLKILSRITEPTDGRIVLRGRLASLLEVGTGFHPELTGRENIFLNGALLGMRASEIRERFDEIVAFSEIERFLDTPVKRYSSGMYVRLAFAVAAHLTPEILVVDEVLAVGDAAFQRKCLGKIGETAKGGRTVLFVSHNMGAVRALCGSGVLLDAGRVAFSGSASDAVEEYMRRTHERTRRPEGIFPALNGQEGIGVVDCNARLADGPDGLCLEVEVAMESKGPRRNIGVGLSVSTLDGIRASVLGASATNCILEELDGRGRVVFRCRGIDRYLSGGDYIIGVWLSRPRLEYLLRVDHAASVSIPARDHFMSGVAIELGPHGVVPLPLEFDFLDGLEPAGALR